MIEKTCGLIGLGNAGSPIAERLLKNGYVLRVYDKNQEAVERLVKLGALRAASAADTVSDLTFVLLPSSVEVKQAVLGPSGVIEKIKSGQVLIELSGTDPECVSEIEKKVIARGGKYLSGIIHAQGAPVVTIPKGLLVIVVGGERDTFELCVEPLKALAEKVLYVPDPGTPKALKIASIMLSIANTIMLAEICTWLEAQKIDPRLFLKAQQIVGATDATSRVEHFFKRAKGYGGALSNTYKDVHQALQIAPQLGIPLPFAAVVDQIQEMARTQGFSRLHVPEAIGKLYELLTGVSLARAAMENPERAFPEPKESEVIYLNV